MCGGHWRSWHQGIHSSESTSSPLRLAFLLILGLGFQFAGEVRAEAEQGDHPDDASAEDKDDSETPDTPKDPAQRQVNTQVKVLGKRGGETTSEWTHKQAASVAVFDLNRRQSSQENLADLLEEVAGLHVRRLGGPSDPSWVTIRGSSARQVEIFVDGIPLNANGTHAVNLSELDLSAYERVEVYRGFSPPELGSSAMGGVVHLQSRPGVRTAPYFEVGYGSWKTRKVTSRFGEAWPLPTGGSADLRATLTYAGTEGNFTYLDDRGTPTNLRDDRMPERANNASDQFDTSLLGRILVGPFSLSLGNFLLWSDQEIPGSRHQRAQEANLDTFQNLVVLRSSFDADATSKFSGHLSWRIRREQFSDPRNEIGLGRPSTIQTFQDVQGGGNLTVRPLPWLQLSPSFQLGYDHYRNTPKEAPKEATTRSRHALTVNFATQIEPLGEKLSILPSIGLSLIDNRDLGASEIAGDFAGAAEDPLLLVPLPRVAIAAKPAPWITIRAALQEGTRPPGFTELYGDRGGVVGNTYLRPERSKSFDTSVRLWKHIENKLDASFEFGGFRVISDDAIVFVANAQNTVVPTNFGATRIEGLELAGSLRILRHIDVSGAFTWSDSEITEGFRAHLGNRIPHVPPYEFDLSLGLRLDPWIQLKYQLHHSSESFESASNLFALPPRSNHSMSLRIAPRQDLPWIRIDLHNLSDERLFVRDRDPQNPNPGDRVVVSAEDFRGNPLAGRSVFVSIGWSPTNPVPRRSTAANTTNPAQEKHSDPL